MAKNDVVLVDAIVEERARARYPSDRTDEVFEFFGFEQLLKDYDLSNDEILSGWLDGRDDGGIDGFYVFINGHLLQDPIAFTWPKMDARIDVWVITCKHHDTFQQAPIHSLLASIAELLDLSLGKSQLAGKYSDGVIQARALLYAAYRRLSAARPKLNFRFAYVSRGDSSAVGDNVRARSNQLIAVTQTLFSQCAAEFNFVGAAELVSHYRKTKTFSLDLTVLEYISKEPRCYVALARLDEYRQFVSDEDGNLRRYLFDSNVRDYLGMNMVNEDIMASLRDPASPDFWWLNNGVTILATNAMVIGKIIQLQDIQIVNGLQTTECLFRYFQTASITEEKRSLLVKIVVSTDAKVRDRIILATNNQSVVDLVSLRATDKVQRDIEAVLGRSEWYYERRKNYYQNIGKPPARFVTPMYVAAGYLALAVKNPAIAAKLKPRFMRNDTRYAFVFSERVEVGAWLCITEVLKRVEDALSTIRVIDEESLGFSARWRHLVGLLAVGRILGRFNYSTRDLSVLNVDLITTEVVLQMWDIVRAQRNEPVLAGQNMKRPWRRPWFVEACCQRAAKVYGINYPQAVGRESFPVDVEEHSPRMKHHVRRRVPSEEFLEQINNLLPNQPWKPRADLEVAKQVGCRRQDVREAIATLIRRGIRLRQKDGVVFDKHGNVVAVDPERDGGA